MSVSCHLAAKDHSSFTTLAGQGQDRPATRKLPLLGTGVERITLRQVDFQGSHPLARQGLAGVNQANCHERAPPQCTVLGGAINEDNHHQEMPRQCMLCPDLAATCAIRTRHDAVPYVDCHISDVNKKIRTKWWS